MASPLHRVEEIFHGALDRPEAERRAYLERECGGDAALLAEVESLLRHQGGDSGAFEAAVQPAALELFRTATVLEAGFRPGTSVGPYRVDQKIGEGGMGAVYLATDTRLGRQVALKAISPTVARTEESRARFLREARSAAALCHPNIATLHDVGETNGTPWLVMEYVKGEALRARLTGALGEATWLRYATQIGAALEHAHARGIVHRDIKAENILIAEDDRVKIIDFGLARAAEQPGAQEITGPDGFVGTLAYAAPELLSGGSASPRSDIYSTGIVLYEMACGAHPFARIRGHALVSAVLSGSFTGCRTLNPRLRRSFASIIERAMAREPAARFRDGAELAAALGRVDQGEEMRADPAPPTLAVMDFVNLARSPELDWLGSGIAETLSTDLAKVKSVRVVSRSRIATAKPRSADEQHDAARAIELGRQLGVRWVVTGAYQRNGGRIRVTTTLIDPATGDSLGAGKVDGQWEELFDVQDRVAGAVLEALTIRLSTTEQERLVPAETRDLEAYEHYVYARQRMYEMQSQSLTAAIQEFERAVGLDPDYALAYSGLGTAHALQFLRTSNPQDIQRASSYLERAIELDPELGEPYPWLANIRIRKNDAEGAFEAGRRGVELQPDLAEAQYFYGGTHYMLPDFRPGSTRDTPKFLSAAIRLQPRFHAAWVMLGATAVFLGRHPEAIEILNEAARLESSPGMMYRFVGSRTLIATAHMRLGAWDRARAAYREALDQLQNSDHLYGTCFQILSACGLGEIEMRTGDVKAAFAHFRHAHRIIREAPRTVGSGRLTVRIDGGLAAAYAVAGDAERAQQLVERATAELEGPVSQPVNATIECSLAQLWMTMATAELRLGHPDAAARCLVRAREKGWQDGVWLRVDPELGPLHDRPEYIAFADSLASPPEIEMPARQLASGAS
jgi:serine/threonine-protein kinase